MLPDLFNLLDSLEVIAPTAQWRRRILSFMDLTSLDSSDTPELIQALCQKAVTPQGEVAAVCVYPEFVATAYHALKNTDVHIATVANFPLGNDNLQDVLLSIRDAIKQGADEIDVVFPYDHYLEGERGLAREFVKECKKVCGQSVSLKVILETGLIHKPTLIADAAKLAIEGGADYIKTSTGKAETGATLEAAAAILLTIKQLNASAGLKISGGIRDVEQVLAYIDLINKVMGPAWLTPDHFRIGASKLIDKLT